MSFIIRDVENMQRSYGVWPEQLCPALGNVTNTALILPEIPCLLSSLFLCFPCCYTKQEASQQKSFFSGGNGELEFLIVVSSSFFCSLLWWPLLLGLVSIWHYKAVFGNLCGTNSVNHVLTGFLCFLQMDRGLLLPPSSLIVLHAKILYIV